jgi:hypothetical protein
MINFAYLLVQGCNNCEYDGIPQLRESIISLKHFHKNCKIYLYYGYDESSKDKIYQMEEFIKQHNLIGINIGYLKHNFPRIEYDHVADSIKNPYRLNILIEKIYILLNHNHNEEVILLDIDTKVKSSFKFDMNIPLLYSNENPLLNRRSLDSFFKKINYTVPKNTRMFNTGTVFIPKNNRKKIAQEALDLVLLMNTISDKERLAKDLDEQISLSIVIFKHYKKINFASKFLDHYMGQHIK